MKPSVCKNCKTRCNFAIHPAMAGTGPMNAEMVLVGEAPGETEDKEGRVFVGKSGKWMRRNILRPLGIDESSIHMRNAVSCRAPKNKTPNKKEIYNCRPRLMAALKKIQPKVIILLGNVPLCSVLLLDNVSGITKWRGKKIWNRELNCWVIPTWHPRAVMTDYVQGLLFRFHQMKNDFKLALQCLEEKPPIPVKAKFFYPTTEQAIVNFVVSAEMSGRVAVDLETDMLDPRNEILGVSLTFKKNDTYYSAYIRWNDLMRGRAEMDFKQLLYHKECTKLWWNMGFDRKFLEMHKCKVDGPCHDGMIMAHLLDENFSKGLKERTWIDLDVGGYDNELDWYKWTHAWTKKKSYKLIPYEVLRVYGAYDPYATYRLVEKYQPLMTAQHLNRAYNIMMAARVELTYAEIQGFTIDMPRIKALDERCERAKTILAERIYKIAGRKMPVSLDGKKPKMFFMSTQQLSAFIFDELGAPKMGKTKKGAWKLDKVVLLSLSKAKVNKRYVKAAQEILKYKYIAKLQKTYLGQAMRFMWEDGKIHSSNNLTGTVTGRVSNSNPCNHNIPKDRLIRSIYTASEGCKLVEGDARTSEMRVMAAESRDEALTRIVLSGLDLHEMTFNEMFGKPSSYKPTQDERRLAKTINFGLIYLISAFGLSPRLGKSVEETEELMLRYFKKFPGVQRWIENAKRLILKNGFITSLFGYVRRLPDAFNDDEYLRDRAIRQGVNAPIQSASTFFAYIVAVRVSRKIRELGLKARLIHVVHDSIIVDTPVKEIPQVKEIIKAAFNAKVQGFPIQMDCDIAVVGAWGEHGESNLETMLEELAA